MFKVKLHETHESYPRLDTAVRATANQSNLPTKNALWRVGQRHQLRVG
jgi:hypothetical protein